MRCSKTVDVDDDDDDVDDDDGSSINGNGSCESAGDDSIGAAAA